jgi:hypothetical protein
MKMSGANTAIREIDIVRMVKLISLEPAEATSNSPRCAFRSPHHDDRVIDDENPK